MEYLSLIKKLRRKRALRSPHLIKAFERNDRADFLPKEEKESAGEDLALPIGFGQTISQPQVVAFMMELLSPRPGQKVLDVGSGSGWTSAILSDIVSQAPGGEVIAVERIPELCGFARDNLQKYGYEEKDILKFLCADGSRRLTKKEYFDRIISAAWIGEIPQAWKDELKIGGRMVVPTGASLELLIKKSEKDFETKEFPGFIFVPLIRD